MSVTIIANSGRAGEARSDPDSSDAGNVIGAKRTCQQTSSFGIVNFILAHESTQGTLRLIDLSIFGRATRALLLHCLSPTALEEWQRSRHRVGEVPKP